MEEIFEKLEDFFKGKDIDFKVITMSSKDIKKMIKEIFADENGIVRIPRDSKEEFIKFTKNNSLDLKELDGLISLDKSLTLKVINNKIQVIENCINTVLIELDYTVNNLLLLNHMNFKVMSKEKNEKEIKSCNKKGLIYSEIVDLFTNIFEKAKINLDSKESVNLIKSRIYFRKFPENLPIKNVLRVHDEFGVDEIGKMIDIDKKYEEVFLKFKKDNPENDEPTIKEFLDYLHKDVERS